MSGRRLIFGSEDCIGLLSASVDRFGVSSVRDFCYRICHYETICSLLKNIIILLYSMHIYIKFVEVKLTI